MIKRFSVIYIGSSKCQLIIGQRGKGAINILDRADYPIRFGVQSFTQGFINFKSVYALCQIINGYIELSKTYDVETIQILGTTALREAKNRIYVLEQIRINTGGHTVTILDQEEEIQLIYRHIVLKYDGDIIKNNSGEQMLAAISTGNLSVALLKDGIIDYHQTAELGYLKMKEILRSMEDNSQGFKVLLSEFIGVNTQKIRKNIRARKIKQLFMSSHEVNVIARLYGYDENQDFYTIDVERFKQLCHETIDLTMNQLLRKFQFLTSNEAETLNHTLILYLRLLNETGVKSFILVPMSIGDAIMDARFQLMKTKQLEKWINLSSYESAKKIGEKYDICPKHSEILEKTSLKIFDAMKKCHELGKRERLLLSILSYLQGVGSYINYKNHWKQSQHIIEATDLIGISSLEKRIMGSVSHAIKTQIINSEEIDFHCGQENFLIVAKLTAILKLAVALDRSEEQKIKKIKCRLKGDKLIIEISSEKNFQLEEYFFKYSGYTMEKVYGITPVLKIKRIEL